MGFTAGNKNLEFCTRTSLLGFGLGTKWKLWDRAPLLLLTFLSEEAGLSTGTRSETTKKKLFNFNKSN